MKITVKVEKEFDVKTLHVEAKVRYWEDTEVNGESDTEDGANIPCKEGEIWKPIINLESGQITNWKAGTTADVHYKVCDAGVYHLKDEEGNTVLTKDGYVPDIMCPEGEWYGDYIIMKIDENGFIADFEPYVFDFIKSED